MDGAPVQNVVELRKTDGGRVILIGTAHICETSPDLVRTVMRRVRPDVVCLELDVPRGLALGVVSLRPPHGEEGGGAQPMLLDAGGRPVAVTYPSPVPPPFPGLLPLLFQTLLGAVMGSMAEVLVKGEGEAGGAGHGALGAEFTVAAREAAGLCAPLTLIDRDVSLTFARMGGEMGVGDLAKALPVALSGVQLPPAYTPPLAPLLRMLWAGAGRDWEGVGASGSDIVRHAEATHPAFTSSPLGRALLRYNRLILPLVSTGRISAAGKAELSSAFTTAVSASESSPEVAEEASHALGAERDTLLAWALAHTPGRTVVGVVGRGHLPGILREWGAVGGDHPRPDALLALPPHHTATNVAPPLCGTLAYLAGVGILIKRKRRGPAVALLSAGCVSVGGAVLIGGAVREGCHRIRTALSHPHP